MAVVISQPSDMRSLGLLVTSSSCLGAGVSHFDEFVGLVAPRNLRGPNLARMAGQPCSSCGCVGQDAGALGHVRCSLDDYSSLSKDGPKEPTLPKFNRLPYNSSAIAKAIEVTEQDATVQQTSGSRRRMRRGRQYRKATPAETLAGSIIGAVCAVGTFKVTLQAYDYLAINPPAQDLPFGLTVEVNQLFLTAVTGFGGLAVSMFGVSSFGLFLLSIKLLKTPPPPPKP